MGEMITSFDGTKLYYNEEIPRQARAVAVIVHGLCEHQGRYDSFAETLHQAGIGTCRYDHRGHGRSEGERTYFSDFHELLEDAHLVISRAITENPGIPVFLIGHSMGGLTAALYGASYPSERLRGIVISGGLTHDSNQLMKRVPDGQDPHIKLPNSMGAKVCSVKEVGEGYIRDPYNASAFTIGLCYALREGMAWLAENVQSFRYPVLMLHGEKDVLVNVKDTYKLFARVSSPDKQMKIYGGLYHEILFEYCKEEVIDDVLEWMEERML